VSKPWELRIHSGLHEGACTPLEPGEHLIGADVQCAFILRDAGIASRHVQLESTSDGWQVRRLDAEPTQAVALAQGELIRLGPVIVSIDAPAAAWPDAAQIQRALEAGAPGAESVAQEAQSSSPETDPSGVVQAEQGSEVSHLQAMRPLDLSRVALARRSPWGWAGAVMAGLCLLVFAGWWLNRDASSTTNPESASLASDQANSAAARAARTQTLLTPIRHALDAMSLVHPPKLGVDDSGRPVVDAGLVSADDHERLALVLSRFNPRPALHVQLEQDVMAALSQFLAARSVELDMPLRAVSLGRGEFQIEGNLRTQDERNLLLAAVRAQLPAGAQIQSALSIAPERAQRMLAELREKVPARIDGQWDVDQLKMVVRLASGDVNRWERALIDADTRYRIPFTARLQFESAQVALQAPVRTEKLPFQIRSVVGGSSPYLVLQDGSRLLLDGQQAGWRLAAIDPNSVVFEASRNRRVVLQR